MLGLINYYGFLDFDYHSHLRFKSINFYFLSTFFQKCTSGYINHVNKVLTPHQSFGVPINKLRICWRLTNAYGDVIDSWIDFAVKNRVQHLELDLWSPFFNGSYIFPRGIGLPNLTVLQLSSVDLTDATLAYLISSDTCPSLQHISVKSAPSLVHVKVVGNAKLKSLEFSVCWGMKDVEISSAVNMVSFGFSGDKDTKITFENVPCLTEAMFGLKYCQNVVMQPSSFLSRLEVLVLDLSSRSSHLLTMSRNFATFDRIKRLELQSYSAYSKFWNTCVMTMIFRCPRLEKFSLKMKYINAKGATAFHQKIRYQYRHEFLQAVEYKGWNGKKSDLKLITEILENTVVLDKVTIDPRTIFSNKIHEIEAEFCDPLFNIIDDKIKKREEAARKAAEKLRRILPKRVALVIL